MLYISYINSIGMILLLHYVWYEGSSREREKKNINDNNFSCLVSMENMKKKNQI